MIKSTDTQLIFIGWTVSEKLKFYINLITTRLQWSVFGKVI